MSRTVLLSWMLSLVVFLPGISHSLAQTPAKAGSYLTLKVEGVAVKEKRWSRALRKKAIRGALQKAIRATVEKWVGKEKWKEQQTKFVALWSSRNAPLFTYGYQVLSEKKTKTLYSVMLNVHLLGKKLRKQFESLQNSTP